MSVAKSRGTASANSELAPRLAAVLPCGHRFRAYHVSTPPLKSKELYAPVPGCKAERTFCEKHFFVVTILPKLGSCGGGDDEERKKNESKKTSKDKTVRNSYVPREVIVYALEVYVYTTRRCTTVFVAKADSTGYLRLLKLPRSAGSPIRDVSTVFLAYLVEKRRRPGIPCVLDLFARAQSQYLFPGSVDYKGKHVLDDRGLIKWWARVLHPLVSGPIASELVSKTSRADGEKRETRVRAYLVIPGLDAYEIRGFVPRVEGDGWQPPHPSWSFRHPLLELAPHHNIKSTKDVPPRCLIPYFPDDPKSRYWDELEEEAGHSTGYQKRGIWKNVHTLEQFWDMMAYRQECSSGRMTGFLWVIYDDAANANGDKDQSTPTTSATTAITTTTTTVESQESVSQESVSQESVSQESVSHESENNSSKKDQDEFVPQTSELATSTIEPRVTTQTPSRTANNHTEGNPSRKRRRKRKSKRRTQPPRPSLVRLLQPHPLKGNTLDPDRLAARYPEHTAPHHHHWPAESRGEKLVSQKDYEYIMFLMLHLDFSRPMCAEASTLDWIRMLHLSATKDETESSNGHGWGYDIVGEKEVPAESSLSVPKSRNAKPISKDGVPTSGEDGVRNIANLVKRKRVASADLSSPPAVSSSSATDTTNGCANASTSSSHAHVLRANLIRKKPKTIREEK